MVGRFKVRPGAGDHDWVVWDNAVNGNRGTGLTPEEADALAADLELQYDVHGPRDPSSVRAVDPPVLVETWQPAGVLDAWVCEGGRWLGRIRTSKGEVKWVDQADVRPQPQ